MEPSPSFFVVKEGKMTEENTLKENKKPFVPLRSIEVMKQLGLHIPNGIQPSTGKKLSSKRFSKKDLTDARSTYEIKDNVRKQLWSSKPALKENIRKSYSLLHARRSKCNVDGILPLEDKDLCDGKNKLSLKPKKSINPNIKFAKSVTKTKSNLKTIPEIKVISPKNTRNLNNRLDMKTRNSVEYLDKEIEQRVNDVAEKLDKKFEARLKDYLDHVDKKIDARLKNYLENLDKKMEVRFSTFEEQLKKFDILLNSTIYLVDKNYLLYKKIKCASFEKENFSYLISPTKSNLQDSTNIMTPTEISKKYCYLNKTENKENVESKANEIETETSDASFSQIEFLKPAVLDDSLQKEILEKCNISKVVTSTFKASSTSNLETNEIETEASDASFSQIEFLKPAVLDDSLQKEILEKCNVSKVVTPTFKASSTSNLEVSHKGECVVKSRSCTDMNNTTSFDIYNEIKNDVRFLYTPVIKRTKDLMLENALNSERKNISTRVQEQLSILSELNDS